MDHSVSPREGKAIRLVEQALAARRGGRGTLSRVGELHRLGGGSRHRAWTIRCQAVVDGAPRQLVLVLRLPRLRRSDSRSKSVRRLLRVEREMHTLAAIEAAAAEFAAPLFVCPVRTRRGTIVGMLQSYVAGRSLAGGELVAQLADAAAQVHRLPLDRFRHLRDLTDRRRWVGRLVQALPDGALGQFPEAGEARRRILEWTARPATASCVVHGDLRPGNVLRVKSRSRPSRLAIVDWELARIGEPAIDLAAILRGNRRIESADDGLERLLAAYRQAGGPPVAPIDVRMHEMLLVLAWLGASWRQTNSQSRRDDPRAECAPSPDYLARELGVILNRLCQAGGKP
jgi:aminoglycoside phosphotransferase (APT) family kinase protein